MDRSVPFVLACSGGPDSMAAADFFVRGGYNFTIAHFNHGTPGSNNAQECVAKWCLAAGVRLKTELLLSERPPGRSTEEWWRERRYEFLHGFKIPIVTAHHLDDAMETWLFTALHGRPRLIPYNSNNIVRPFLLNSKKSMVSWCRFKNVPFVIDPSNEDLSHPRNRIRCEIIPSCLKVNPGLGKVIRKKYLSLKRGSSSE